MSINIVLEEIKGTPSSISPILGLLHNDKQILSTITKPDLNHLVSRTLNLVRSPQPYNKWCGLNLVRVICEDYAILASEGNAMLSSVMKVLESYNATIDVRILTSAIETVNFMCDSIRGKPALTREILTPKLGSIIGHLMEYLHFAPVLALTSLQRILKFHPTTFRPFGNKLRGRLVGLMNSGEFGNFPKDLKKAVYDTVAMLPVIEKNEPEGKWNADVVAVLGELNELVGVYQEFLNFKDDQDMVNLIKKIAKPSSKLLADMSIDFNNPGSILKISENVSILVGLLKSYVSVETPFSVRVPLGLILITCEIITTINVKFLSFKGDVRDEQIKKLIKVTLVENYRSVIGLLSQLTTIYQGALVPHIPTIWSFLETLIPYKNKRIVDAEIVESETLFVDLLDCMVDYLSLVGYVADNSQLLRFIDLALVLIEPRIKSQDTPSSKTPAAQQSKKQKKKKNTSSVPLSDILSHEHLFTTSIPRQTLTTVRRFVSQILTTVASFPPTQHYKLMRYLIVECVHGKFYNLNHTAPPELKGLLVDAVLCPGYEKVSVLPIVSSILGAQSQVLSVFNNPRFPALPKYINSVGDEGIIEEEEEDDEEEEAEVKRPVEELTDEHPTKKRKVNEEGVVERKVEVTKEDVPVEDKPQLFSKESIQVEEAPAPVVTETKVEITEKIEIEDVKPEVAVAEAEESDENDGSDFEMPEINIDVDSDDE